MMNKSMLKKDGKTTNKSEKMHPKFVPKSIKNRSDSATPDFLIFAKRITLKPFFRTIQGPGNAAKSSQNSCKNRCVENR